jgi:hypothetical protein
LKGNLGHHHFQTYNLKTFTRWNRMQLDIQKGKEKQKQLLEASQLVLVKDLLF